MGCLGNGITCCNKAIEENGDYKDIAHISSKGNIKFYVNESYIPEDALVTIRETARLEREKFLKYWIQLPPIKQYEIMLDDLPYSILKDYIHKKDKTLSEKIVDLTGYYMTQN